MPALAAPALKESRALREAVASELELDRVLEMGMEMEMEMESVTDSSPRRSRHNPSMMQPAPWTRETESHGASRCFVGENHPSDRAYRRAADGKNATARQCHPGRK